MDFYSLSDKAIGEELGKRIKALRLRKNITQTELAAATTLSVNAIKSLESGRGKLSTLTAVLRELGALDDLNSFIPETSISPIQLAKMQGKVRERASGGRLKNKPQDGTEW
ncbi:helix-turn-helix domain-containing protein [Sulfuriflexus mobilis]|uniref:helix-turn-helix domain-containing protein n=1 Tax=Sulfuriflexus mobilis TaxID=1811807 RepID=UPI000F81C70D|nr:helix-turn-helix transcriptional regulator [Sulfuriflexus mobilis]